MTQLLMKKTLHFFPDSFCFWAQQKKTKKNNNPAHLDFKKGEGESVY